MPKGMLSPKRRLLQAILFVLWMILPLASINGVPLARMDIPAHTLFFFGLSVRIEEFYLLLFLAITSLLGFLLVTVLLGRVWCGWLCPQTFLNDFVEYLPERFKSLKNSNLPARLLRHIVPALISVFMTFAFFAYFMPYGELFRLLASPFESPVLFFSVSIMVIFIYLDAVLVGRGFCKSYCPYGRLQSAFMNQSTLNLAFCEEVRDKCIRCSSCVKACPMGVDIRLGFQIECINCGRCLDACRSVMQRKKDGDGLIAYRFGDKSGARPGLSGSLVLLLLLFSVFSVILVYSTISRKKVSLSVQRNPFAQVSRVVEANEIQAWWATIDNRSDAQVCLRLAIGEGSPQGVKLTGQTDRISISGNNNRQLMFFVTKPTRLPDSTLLELQLSTCDGLFLDKAKLPL